MGILLVSGGFYIYIIKGNIYAPSPQHRQLFSFVETLSPEALFSGDPCLLDDIPLYAKRAVILSCEQGDFKSPQLVQETLRAYYAADFAQILNYCQKYGVDYLLVNTDRYLPGELEKKSFFYEPFNTEIAAWLNGRSFFALQEIPDEQKLFKSENLYVVGCSPAALQISQP